MSKPVKDQLDPFRVLLGVLASAKESDLMIAAAHLAGLQVDLSLAASDAGTHVERIRVLQPRILDAYDDLDQSAQLAAAQAAVTNLGPKAHVLMGRIEVALANLGWIIQDGQLTPIEPTLREMFFPKGSQWDAFVLLRKIMERATQSVIVVDAYADSTVFHLLTPPPQPHLRVEVLCSKYATAVAAAARSFVAQFPAIETEVRASAKDFHDRFVVVDEQDCVHLGASIKDAGKTAFMISRVEDDENRAALLAAIRRAWAAGAPVA